MEICNVSIDRSRFNRRKNRCCLSTLRQLCIKNEASGERRAVHFTKSLQNGSKKQSKTWQPTLWMELHSRTLIMQRVHRVLWIKVSRDMTDRRASPFVSHSRTWSRQPSIIVFSAAKVENERVTVMDSYSRIIIKPIITRRQRLILRNFKPF